jgi:TonB family protein
MRCCVIICLLIVISGGASARRQQTNVPTPVEFVVGRHTFFDFGPPNDFYELFVVRQVANRISVEKITLTPAGACTQPAKVETASASMTESIPELLGKTNPCTIPEKELRRELKRCKKCLVFSGANVAMEVQCGTQSRIVRADILDRDMFDPAPNTPEHTSWTMRLLARLDDAVGPGVMDKPIFPVSEKEGLTTARADSETLQELSSGRYDLLFQGATDKASEVYHGAQNRPPLPTVKLLSSSPFQPEVFVAPGYPPLARLARVEGLVVVKVDVNESGGTGNLIVESGHPLLQPAVKGSAINWKFPKDAVNQKVELKIEFTANCAGPKQ